jgi:hypothetical protein
MSQTKKPSLPARLPNSVKHGAFAKVAIFPDEDPVEFQGLRSSLVDDVKPDGPIEEDAVTTMATCLWRKRRMQVHIAAKLAERQNNRQQAARLALGALGLEPDGIARVLRSCVADIRERIEQKFPRATYATESEWSNAVRQHLEVVLRSELVPPDAEAVPEAQPFDLSAFFYTPGPTEISDLELIETELKTIERLDAEIDRALKRLLQTKAAKQLMNSPNLQLYAPDVTPFSTASTSRTRKGGSNSS